ncbi:MAG: 3-hydroxyacyl-CoA dehydrogenase [Bacteriovoracaceae bacterium]|jgi:3-hydroxyacyl-CoA dehydrogenase / enoyl-CoA hydratase / 3-hydroxybutyryl-CoA epimerase|nr:3-hydroxyacyl-CoA dehydrogenase [Bacteriovoracaceae bacterium]
MLNITRENDGIVIVEFDVSDRPMNVIHEGLLTELEKTIPQIYSDDTTKGVIFTSRRPEFIAGADLAMILKADDYEKTHNISWRLHCIFEQIETSSTPSIAAINGTALGGGLEVALACHVRIAVDHPKLRLGLPEVTLGLLPGAGGTQRLPRIIGLEASLPLLLEGKKIGPKKALQLGLITELCPSMDHMIESAKKLLLSGNVDKNYKSSFPNLDSTLCVTRKMVMEKTHGLYPAPLKIIDCLERGLKTTMKEAIKIEANAFAELALSKEAKNMITTLFFGIGFCNKRKISPEYKNLPKKVGILGAGMMGAGVAHATAMAGIECMLKDRDLESAEKGKLVVEKILEKAVKQKKLDPSKKEKVLALITPSGDPNIMAGCDLVIEAVIENRELKALVTKESEAVMDSTGIFASNTSTLPITGLATASMRPDNFIGLHFFSPVDKMPLVEIIKGEKSSEHALNYCLAYVKKIKKTPIVVNDGRGFYTSRVFTTYINEGIRALHEGVPAEHIEKAGVLSGMPVGPLKIADEVGLDLIHHIYNQTIKDLGEASVDKNCFEAIKLFVEELKRVGRKSSSGFYDYQSDGKNILSPLLVEHFGGKNPVDEDLLKQRLMAIQCIESIKCLEEGILENATDGDVGSILGWGFPACKGGTLRYVESEGLVVFKNRCANLATQFGDRFSPPTLLTKLIDEGKTGFIR